MLDENMLRTLLWLILLLPLVSGAAWLLTGRQANGWAGWASAGLTVIGLLLTGWAFSLTGGQSFTLQTDWIQVSEVLVSLSFQLDALTWLMLGLVHFIALCVQVYSISYLHDEPGRYRYFGYLSLFVGAMLGVVLAGNLIVLYVFWELVGLTSYLLIGFWHRRTEAALAARKAFLMNRVGDAGLLLGIFLVLYQTGTTDLAELAARFDLTSPLATTAGLLLFCGCIAKSAQFPLMTWLPDAMEGPTPASALIHAATMVAAGIFLLARIHFMLTPDALTVIVAVGLITLLMSAYAALFQTDIKKVLAFSTVSQLGLMVVGMGTGNVAGAMFHLTTHAFFKAGLFLAAGSVIHGAGTQDMRQMGGLRRKMPLTFTGYMLCAAALAGIPLFSGFLSKEAILTGIFDWAAGRGPLAYGTALLTLLSSGLTALYLARQVRLIFFGDYRNTNIPAGQVHESGLLLTVPVLVLALFSLAFPFSWNPFSPESGWFYKLIPSPEAASVPVSHGLLAGFSIAIVAMGVWLGFRLQEPAAADQETLAVRLSRQNWYLDDFYDRWVISPSRWFAETLALFDRRAIDGAVDGTGMGTVVLAHVVGWVDRRLVDGIVNGMAWLAGRLGRLTRLIQSGRVQSYIVAAVAGLLVLIWLMV